MPLPDGLASNSEECLFAACAARNNFVVERNIVEGKISPNCRNAQGATPMHVAALQGAAQCCLRLAQLGAEVDAIWEGSSPLHLATSESHEDTVALLIDLGADLALRDAQGFTALHLAALRNNRVLASYLISAGANPHLVDGDGKTVAQRWNVSAVSPLIAQKEKQATKNHATEVCVTDVALLQRFKSMFRSYMEETVVPASYGVRAVIRRTASLEELRQFFLKKVDPCGLPPSVLEKTLEKMLLPAVKKDAVRIQFEDFCVFWLSCQSKGFL
jgi:ankyrin repeat protein